jgi:gliding motility-associated-like protein
VPGCIPSTFVSGTSTTQVSVASIAGIDLEIIGSELICANEDLSLTSVSNGTIASYVWTAPDGSISTNTTLDILNFNESNVGMYFLTTNYGCPGLDIMDSIFIQLQDDDICYPKPNYYMPNVFSPNGDGQNDILYVYGKAIAQMTLIIYDRFGEIVFYSDKMTQGWDGTYNGTLLNTAVFAYQ